MVAELRETSTLAPAILEENIAALSLVAVARQIIMHEVTVAQDTVAELTRARPDGVPDPTSRFPHPV